MTKTSNSQSNVVAHHLPHRTRIKLPRTHRDAATIASLTDSVKRVSKVQSVEVNPRTGSMVVYHEEDTEILESINGALGEVAETLLEAALEAESISFPGLSIVAHLVTSVLGKADNHISKATNNVVDLKTMLPVSFLVAGIAQAGRNAAWFGQVPTWVLFYMAYDSYMRFHSPSVNVSSQKTITEAGVQKKTLLAEANAEALDESEPTSDETVEVVRKTSKKVSSVRHIPKA